MLFYSIIMQLAFYILLVYIYSLIYFSDIRMVTATMRMLNLLGNGRRRTLSLNMETEPIEPSTVGNSVFTTVTRARVKITSTLKLATQTSSVRPPIAQLHRSPLTSPQVSGSTPSKGNSTTAESSLQPNSVTIKPQFRGFDMNYDPWTGIRTAAILGSMLFLLTVYIIYKAKCSKSSLTAEDIAYYEYYRKRIDARKMMQARMARAAARCVQKPSTIIDFRDPNINRQPIIIKSVPNEINTIPVTYRNEQISMCATAEWVHSQPLYTAIPQPIEVMVDINPQQLGGVARRSSSDDFNFPPETNTNGGYAAIRYTIPPEDKVTNPLLQAAAADVDERRPSSSLVCCPCDDSRYKQLQRSQKRFRHNECKVTLIEDPFLASSFKDKGSASFPQVRQVTSNRKPGTGKCYHRCPPHDGRDSYTMVNFPLPQSRLEQSDDCLNPSRRVSAVQSEWDESVHDLPPLLSRAENPIPSTSNTYSSISVPSTLPYNNKAVIFYIDSDCASNITNQSQRNTDYNAQFMYNASRRSSSSMSSSAAVCRSSRSNSSGRTPRSSNQSTSSSGGANPYYKSGSGSSSLRENNTGSVRGGVRVIRCPSSSSTSSQRSKRVTPPNSLALDPNTKCYPDAAPPPNVATQKTSLQHSQLTASSSQSLIPTDTSGTSEEEPKSCTTRL